MTDDANKELLFSATITVSKNKATERLLKDETLEHELEEPHD